MADAIALIDYGAGNLHSVHNALKAAGAERVAVTATPCVRGPLYAHAPSESGFFHVDPAARPRTCLVSQAMARILAGQP